MIELDKKLLDAFQGYVVRKDIVRSVKGTANVPVFVLEYLLANSCSTDDEEKIKEGVENVQRVLREHYVNPDEANLVQAKIQQRGSYKVIDKISVRLDPSRDKYWAHLSNLNIKDANISEDLVSSHEKLMTGGIWAIIDIDYDPLQTIGSRIYPFVISKIRPIQLSNFEEERIAKSRETFDNQEWLNVLLRSGGFFSEWMHHQRKKSYVNAIDEFFILGSQMKQRDTKPVRKTVSGLIKLMHPDGNYTKEDVRQYLELAIEMRRRVKEQLKRIGGMEFWDTNFSYIDKETQEETFVTLPEERGSNLIEDVPLAPGTCYTATSDGDKVALVKLEVVSIPGNGKLTISGNASTEVKEDVRNTYNYIRANEKTILSQQHSLNKLDVNIQITALLGSTVHKGIGGAVFTALVSSVFNRSLKPALAVLGNISIGGAIERALNFSDRVSLLSENGAKNVLVPMDNLQEMANLPAAILGKTDVPFYSSSQMLIQKIL